MSSGFGLGILPIPKGTGHSWVCDGSQVTTYYSGYTNTYKDFWGRIYSETLYTSYTLYRVLHMNWGWGTNLPGGTNNDGWYLCDVNYTLAPNGNDYQYFQTIIFNIHP
jgi:hypothetical protein